MGTKWVRIISVLAVCGLAVPGRVDGGEPGLGGWWKLDETSGLVAADSSGFSNNGTLMNMLPNQWTQGFHDGALEFFGSRNYVDCGTGSSLDVTNDFTIAAWVQMAPGTDGVYMGIAGRLTRRNTDADYWGFALVRYSSNVFRLWVADGNTGTITGMASSDAAYTDSGWHHVTGVRKGKVNSLYVDGVAQKETSTTEFIPSQEFFHIGRQYNYLDDRYFIGKIDDVRVYNRALAAAEILTLAARPQAHDPSPADGAQNVAMPLLKWQAGTGAVFHSVYFGTTPTPGQAEFVGKQPFPMYFHPPGLTPGTTYYWRIDEVAADNTVTTGDVWSFTSLFKTAYGPEPRDGAKWIATDATLAWSAGQNADKHEVYFGTSRDEVAAAAASTFQGKQLDTKFDPGPLTAQTTYYWRVDESDAQGATQPGKVWSFTTIGPGGGVKGEYFNNMSVSGSPVLTRIEPEINFNWGDPGGPGAPVGVDNFSGRWTAELEVAFTDTYTFITNSDDGVRLWVNNKMVIDNWTDHSPTENRGRILLTAGQVYPLVMEYYENGGGAVAQLSWQSSSMPRQIIPAGPLQPPLRAGSPNPPNGAVDVIQTPVLRWTAGEKAAGHAVYFGDDPNSVANATADNAEVYKGPQVLEEIRFTPEALEWNKTYYWRIDEVNEAEPQSPWKGSVWSFTTANFIVVDNFEGYTDEEGTGNRIYETWIDGWATGTSGSTVGYADAPFAEQKMVHGGIQSMPLDYNNINSPWYSEAEREFSPVVNWTVNGMNALVLSFRGYPAKFVETSPGQYTISSNTGDVWGAADNFRFVYKRLNGDGTIVAKVNSVTNTSSWAKAGVMIRESLDPASSYAFMFPTPDGRRAFQNRSTMGGNAVSAHSASGAVTLPVWVKVERKANQLTAYYSLDGKTWTKQPDDENTGTDASPNPQSISMVGSVYIGMAVTSNNSAGGACLAEFSDVTTTGSVTGNWTVADVGPNTGNDPDTLYLAVQDSANQTAVLVHPDPAAVTASEWQQWSIPLADLSAAGVNVAKVKKLIIGVGDRANPQPDGTGRVFIDDIAAVAR